MIDSKLFSPRIRKFQPTIMAQAHGLSRRPPRDVACGTGAGVAVRAWEWHIAIAQISVDNFVVKPGCCAAPTANVSLVTNVNPVLQGKNYFLSMGCVMFVSFFLQIAAEVRWVGRSARPVENAALHAGLETA
jgi:hypothetical protein